MGDFAHRRLPEPFRSTWDQWLQRGLSRLRDRHADWTDRYLEAPIWCFALGPRLVGDGAWIGVLMPSVDGVGRYFPFTLAVPLEVPVADSLRGGELAQALQWWTHATQAALEGLEGDMDALRFDASLRRVFAGGGSEPVETDVESVGLPAAGASLWLGDPCDGAAISMLSCGLPREEQFDALFLGFAQEG